MNQQIRLHSIYLFSSSFCLVALAGRRQTRKIIRSLCEPTEHTQTVYMQVLKYIKYKQMENTGSSSGTKHCNFLYVLQSSTWNDIDYYSTHIYIDIWNHRGRWHRKCTPKGVPLNIRFVCRITRGIITNTHILTHVQRFKLWFYRIYCV